METMRRFGRCSSILQALQEWVQDTESLLAQWALEKPLPSSPFFARPGVLRNALALPFYANATTRSMNLPHVHMNLLERKAYVAL